MLFYENLLKYIEGQREKLEVLRFANIPDRGLIIKVLLPDRNQDRAANLDTYSLTYEVEQIEIDCLGIKGERHRRISRPSTGREKLIYPKGTLIREHRHIVAVSPYDCKILSDKLEVEVTPELLGANLVIGREDGQDYSLSALPEYSYLLIAEKENRELPKPPLATLRHYTLQQGCGITGNSISKNYDNKSLTQKFVVESKENRGILCSVEHPAEKFAIIKAGQKVFFRFPMGITP